MPLDSQTLNNLRIDRSRERTSSSRVWWISSLVALILIASIAWIASRSRAATVRVATVVQGGGSAGNESAVLNASGYVTARRQATVSSKVTGKIIDVLFDEGVVVKSGQELARLDSSIQRAAFRLAEAQVTASRSSLEETRVRIEQAQLDANRARNLANEQVSSRADFDHADAELKALRARLAAQQDQLSVAERQMQLAKQDLEDTIVRAPFDGVVVTKDAQPGEMISPMSAGGGFTRTGIGTIVDMSSLEIEVDVSETYINRVRPGQQVEAILDAYPDWRIPAHVITVIPTADRQKATFKVRIAFDLRDPRILPEMGVKVSFKAPEETKSAGGKTVLRVPKAAIRHEGDADVLFVYHDRKLERRAIEVNSMDDDTATISSGVTAGEQVVVAGPEELEDGQRVRVQAEPKS